MLDWPQNLCPIAGGYAPFVRSLSGGQSLSGFEQVQPQMHDRWSAAFTFRVRGKADIFLMRSLLTQLRGRAGTIRVPTFEAARAPLTASTPGAPAIPGAPIGTAVTNPQFIRRWPELRNTQYEFSALPSITGVATILAADRVSFAADPASALPAVGNSIVLAGINRRITRISGTGPLIFAIEPALTVAPGTLATPATLGSVAATVNANAALNATSLDIHVTVGGAPLAGNFFSIADKLYVINGISTLSAGIYRCAIWPWLRVAATAGDLVNLATPRCEMRLASDDVGAEALRSLTRRSFGQVALQFDEVA
jgi:hypothetical protein